MDNLQATFICVCEGCTRTHPSGLPSLLDGPLGRANVRLAGRGTRAPRAARRRQRAPEAKDDLAEKNKKSSLSEKWWFTGRCGRLYIRKPETVPRFVRSGVVSTITGPTPARGGGVGGGLNTHSSTVRVRRKIG